MRKLIIGAALAALITPAAPALADPMPYFQQIGWDDDDDDDDDGDRRRWRGHRGRGHYGETWRGRDGRMYCRRSNGTTGLIVGAAGGALLGRAIDTRGERTTGTVLGAAAGALLGREATRQVRCR
jgi:hypothetical protein